MQGSATQCLLMTGTNSSTEQTPTRRLPPDEIAKVAVTSSGEGVQVVSYLGKIFRSVFGKKLAHPKADRNRGKTMVGGFTNTVIFSYIVGCNLSFTIGS